MKTLRRKDGGVSLGRFIIFKIPPYTPFSKVGLDESVFLLYGMGQRNNGLFSIIQIV
jgi:hypothetical protein